MVDFLICFSYPNCCDFFSYYEIWKKDFSFIRGTNDCFGMRSFEISNQHKNAYYTQILSAKGIIIKAPASVDPKALQSAKEILSKMLQNIRPDIQERLVSRKASLAIIPRDKYVTSLPEFSHLSGRIDINGNPYDSFKIRGLGAKSQPMSATSEENLLKLPNDPFRSEDITVHEFAHAIMNLGFSPDDMNRINLLYKNAILENKFRGTFAMTRVDEFWAELSQSYFSVNNEIGGPKQILKEDPDSFIFLEFIYDYALIKAGWIYLHRGLLTFF